MSRNLEALTSPEPSGPHKPVMGLLYRYNDNIFAISGFRRDVNELFALLDCYAVQIAFHRRFGTTYSSHLQVPRTDSRPLKTGPTGCPETSVNN
jgi:hypothetical protein